jgi:iron-sulfur cluster assembly protein
LKQLPFVLCLKDKKGKNIMITVSETAKTQLAQLMTDSGFAIDSYLRVGVEGGGCSGLSYKMDFDTEMRDGDQLFEDKGVKILVDKKSFLYLVGTELEYSGGLNGKGFAFNNPNATRTCGCGESFAV